MGFNRDTATTLVHHTLLGSTLYAMETGEHPAILRNMVTSPAGTTASAIYELENGKFRVVIKDVSLFMDVCFWLPWGIIYRRVSNEWTFCMRLMWLFDK